MLQELVEGGRGDMRGGVLVGVCPPLCKRTQGHQLLPHKTGQSVDLEEDL